MQLDFDEKVKLTGDFQMGHQNSRVVSKPSGARNFQRITYDTLAHLPSNLRDRCLPPCRPGSTLSGCHREDRHQEV